MADEVAAEDTPLSVRQAVVLFSPLAKAISHLGISIVGLQSDDKQMVQDNLKIVLEGLSEVRDGLREILGEGGEADG